MANTDQDFFEVTTAQLAELLRVSVTTVSEWVKKGKIQPKAERSVNGGGRPGYLFNLYEVQAAFSQADWVKWAVAADHWQAVSEEIAERNAELGQALVADAEAVPDVEVFKDEIARLQDLVVDLAVALHRGAELETETQLAVLDILLSRIRVVNGQ